MVYFLEVDAAVSVAGTNNYHCMNKNNRISCYIVQFRKKAKLWVPDFLFCNLVVLGSPYRAIYHFASEILAFVVLKISTNWYHMVKIAENDDM